MSSTLPDILRKDMRILSIGLNPSLPSVTAGYYFANPRNRFWKALNASNLVNTYLQPGLSSQHILLDQYHIGFTDVVKRPTASAKDLSAQDYRRDIPDFLKKIDQYNPSYCWFHGKVALGYTLRIAGIRDSLSQWGLQSFRLNNASVYMSPNPSSANAVFSLTDLIESYNQLFDLVHRRSVY